MAQISMQIELINLLSTNSVHMATILKGKHFIMYEFWLFGRELISREFISMYYSIAKSNLEPDSADVKTEWLEFRQIIGHQKTTDSMHTMN